MGLSCSCEDFDKGEFTKWWDDGGRRYPPAGERCCECNAPLPGNERAACFASWEVFEPETPMPPNADDEEACGFPTYPTISHDMMYGRKASPAEWDEFHVATAEWEQAYGPAIEFYRQQRENWERETGWDSDFERCERKTGYQFRCERCQGLAEAIEELGYCMVGPGEVIDNHIEYVEEHTNGRVKWVPDADGVWNPRRWTRSDYVKAATRRRWWRVKSWFRIGWKLDLRYRVIWPVERRIKKWRGEKWPQPAKMKIFGSRMY